MTRNQEILDEMSLVFYYSKEDMVEAPLDKVLQAMDISNKEAATGFFKWYWVKMATFIEYITKIKPLVESHEIEEKIKEHEGSTIEELFDRYIQSLNQQG